MRSIFAASFVFAFASIAACGGEAPQPIAPPQPAPSAAPPPSASAAAEEAPPTAWSVDLPKKQKAAFMKHVVMPRMSKVFQAADGARYAKFTCTTCHGPEFKPSPKDFLPKLTIKDGKPTAAAEHPEVVKFMAEKVVPEMASIFGVPPYDPATHQGFGCGGCHAIEMK